MAELTLDSAKLYNRVVVVSRGPAAAPRERIESLDGLRGVAAVAVMLFHFASHYGNWYGFPRPLSFDVTYFAHLRYGVQLFFLISGFVIFMTIERSEKPADFVRSRFSRLYPAYWLSMLVSMAVLAAHVGPPARFGPFEPRTAWELARRSMVNVTMIQVWFHIGSINWVYWTLQIEMSFYAMMLFLLWRRWIARTVPFLAGMVALGVADALLNRAWPNPASPWIRDWLALDYIHVLTLGVVIYKLRLQPRLAYVPIVALCLLAPFSQYRPYQNPLPDSAITGTLAIVVYLATTGRLPFLVWRPMIFLGSISYSLYLNHELIGDSIIYQLTRRGVSPELSVVAAIAVPIILATAVTYRFERPIARLIRGRRKPLASSPGTPGNHPRVVAEI
jgi:peptidoglycan/LPS O-acetylase OafA/YrhL